MDLPYPEAARELLVAKAEEALTFLASPGLDDRGVHGSRKALKSARAALRLLRPRLGETFYRRENIALRDAASALSPLRDARTVLASLGLLSRDARRRKALRAALDRQRELLQHRLDRAQREFAADPAMLRRCADRVRNSLERTRTALHDAGEVWQVIDGFKRIYRSGRRAFRQASRLPSDEALHELRKQTKYLLTTSSLLCYSGIKGLRNVVRQADRVAERLGDDHDLAVLQRTMLELRADTDDGLLLPLIERRRTKLQARAMHTSRRLFARKPRCVLVDIRRMKRSNAGGNRQESTARSLCKWYPQVAGQRPPECGRACSLSGNGRSRQQPIQEAKTISASSRRSSHAARVARHAS